MTDRLYARFYYAEFIRDYPDVWSDPQLLSAWWHLFIPAEQMWPLPAELPRSVRPKSLAYLIERGLVTVNGDTYCVKGMATERGMRSQSARNAAAVRWQSERNAESMPSSRRAEDETNTPPPPVGRRKDGTNPRAVGSNPRANGTSPRQEREGAKRAPVSLHEILTAAAKGTKA